MTPPVPWHVAWRRIAQEMDRAKADVRRALLDSPHCTMAEMERAQRRFQVGWEEHKGEFWGWPESRFWPEIYEELIDAMIYRAACRALHPRHGDGTWH